LLWLERTPWISGITPVFYCFREREEVLKIFENYCGARLTRMPFRIGGLQYEIYDGSKRRSTPLQHFLPKVDEYESCSPTIVSGSPV